MEAQVARSLKSALYRSAAAVLACVVSATAAAQTPAANLAQSATRRPTPAPTLAEARKALAGSLAAARALGANVSCSVVDASGDLVALARMDKARFFSADLARGKAMMSAIFGLPSASLLQFASTAYFRDLRLGHPGLVAEAGALPITRNNQLVGAIGCSGIPGHEEEVARAGLAAAF